MHAVAIVCIPSDTQIRKCIY